MQPAVLIRLRPAGPWRYGPGDGGHDRVDTQFRSDRLYSAVTLAMKQMGWLEEWLEATAKSSAAPAVAFTSLFPFQGATLFVNPPATLWPPPASLLTTPSPVFLSKMRWKAATFVPISLVETILLGQNVLADQWLPDPESSCLLRRDRLSTTPFRTVLRSGAAVDRVSGSAASVHASACVEFEAGAGLWTLVRYRDEGSHSDWAQRITAAFRLLADSGFGGKRSSGWGQTETPEFEEGPWPGLLMPKLARALARGRDTDAHAPEPPLHWLLSLFSPGETDKVDWRGGEYRLLVRGGYVEGGIGSKKQVRMVAEGSVLAAADELVGASVDVAPEAFQHPVYRSGMAVSLRLPAFVPAPPPEAAPSELDEILTELEGAAAEERAEETGTAEIEAVTPELAESPAVEEPSAEERFSEGEAATEEEERPAESIETPEVDPHASPETPADIESHSEVSPEVEPQDGSEGSGSIEDPAGQGEGPDHGL